MLSLCLMGGMLAQLLMGNDSLTSEPLPESILNEALQVVGPPSASNANIMAAIATRQAKVSSCKTAQDIFQRVIDSVGPLENLHERDRATARASILRDIAANQRLAGCTDTISRTIQKATDILRQRNQELLKQDADKENAAAYYRLDLDLDLGFLYWAAGDFEALDATLKRIASEVEAAQWSPDLQSQQAARLLARRGRDAEAMRILQLYESFYDRDREVTKDSYYLHWLYRVTNLAAVAETQMEAGHVEMGKATVKRALQKARSIPVDRLNEVLGKGNSLQSAALRTVAWAAAKLGETGIALEAQNAITDHAYDESVAEVIKAFAKAGDVATAEKLVQQYKCCGREIAFGLAERDNWVAAVKADDKWQTVSDPRLLEVNSRSAYFEKLGEARTRVQGSSESLLWARKQSGADKIHALLGIVDALSETTKTPRGESLSPPARR